MEGKEQEERVVLKKARGRLAFSVPHIKPTEEGQKKYQLKKKLPNEIGRGGEGLVGVSSRPISSKGKMKKVRTCPRWVKPVEKVKEERVDFMPVSKSLGFEKKRRTLG